MSPSQTKPFILTPRVLPAIIYLQLLILPTQCTALRRDNAAFTSNYISNQRPSTRKTTVLLYQIIEEPLNKQRISPSPTNTEDALVDDTSGQVVFGDNNDSKNLTLDTNEEIEDNKDWISATRTLGSLIFQMQDETKDSNVDVFGRPLNLPLQIDQFGLPKDYDNGDGTGNGWQSSLASYLLKLKRDEEDNRERFEENKTLITKEEGESSKISMNIQLDQVSLLECIVAFESLYLLSDSVIFSFFIAAI